METDSDISDIHFLISHPFPSLVGQVPLLEKYLKAPVAGAFWYRFFEPVPRKWYQRLETLVPGKLTGT